MAVDHLLHFGCLKQAAHHPMATAVICGDESLSYGELVARARLVAHRLSTDGVGPETVVGVLVDRSIEAAIGFLGVLLAGGAYLPLDPHQPNERLRLIVTEAGARIVLTGRDLDYRISDEPIQRLSIADIARNASGSVSTSPAEDIPDPQDLAYVIFTSGSTGKPKGVMIEHRGAANTIRDINERFHVGPNDRVLCLSSFGFDLSVYDLFGLWTAGGAVVIPTPNEAFNPLAWSRLIREHHVTIWNSVPALLEMLVASSESTTENAELSSIRLVLLSGDWIPVALPDRFRRLQPAGEIISLGGATEASIWSLLYRIESIDSAWKSIPYGRAMREQSIYVLDAKQKKCPPGEVGEIYIGGIGVARGYVGQPDLTRLQFLSDPFSPDGLSRLYKTGDLGRLLSDGNVELLGRQDCQVKINGQRIELGEIEVVLSRHPQVRESVVVAATGVAGRKRLVGFVVTSDDMLTSEALCDFLHNYLPKYMVPAVFHFMASFPLTANGKVDRKKLQDDATVRCRASARSDVAIEREQDGVGSVHDFELEEVLVELWQIVFERQDIGPNDDFFGLGGDSLTAAALAARIESRLGLNVTMADLIQFATIRQLAACFQKTAGAKRENGSVVIRPGRGCSPVFFVPPILANLFGMRELAQRLPPELPIIGLQPLGLGDDEQPDHTIAEIASHYLEQVRRHQASGRYHFVGYSLGGTVAFEMASMLVESGEPPPVLIMIDAPRNGRPAIVRAAARLAKFLSVDHVKWLQRLKKPIGVQRSEMQAKLFEAHYSALCQYRPRRYPGTAHWIRASQRPGIIKRLVDDICGTWDWQTLLPQSPVANWVSGSHDTIFERPYVDELALHLEGILQTTSSLSLGAISKSN